MATALTHSSYLHEHPGTGARDFERLEFLGDAVVDLIVGEELFRRFPNATEGELTSLRASLVSSAPLAAIAMRVKASPGPARPVRAETPADPSSKPPTSADRYAWPPLRRTLIATARTGGRSRVGLAASLYESFVGAVYVESGFDRARSVVLETMGGALDEVAATPMKSAKTLLQEWAQSEHLSLPNYRVLDATGPEHRRDFVVEVEVNGHLARGSGASKRDAQEAAAAELLRIVST